MQSLSVLVAGADSPGELPRSKYMAAVPGPPYSPYAMADMVLTAPFLELYTDTGATYHYTNDLHFLARVSQCEVFCGGIGSGITFTHVGLDLRFPVGLRKTFYAKDGACLTSPGYLSSTGRAAYVQQADGVFHLYVDGVKLFSAPRLANNLYATPLGDFASHPSVDASNLILDHEYAKFPCPPLECPSGFPLGAVNPLLLLADSSAVSASAVTSNAKLDNVYYSPICERVGSVLSTCSCHHGHPQSRAAHTRRHGG